MATNIILTLATVFLLASLVSTYTLEEYKADFQNKTIDLAGIQYIQKYFPTEKSSLNKAKYAELLWHVITNKLDDLPDNSNDLTDIQKLVKEWVGKFVALNENSSFDYIDIYNHHIDGEFMDYFKIEYGENGKEDAKEEGAKKDL